MGERETMEENRCIVMFPFMGQGHMIPFLALALQIEQRGYPIIFVNTPLNIAKLRRSIPPTSSIRLAHLPFNSSDHGLPPDSENTDVLPYSLVLQFLEASTTLRPAFRSLLADLIRGGPPPLCVVADIFFGWSAEVAHDLGLFHVIFSGAGGFGLGCYHSVWLNLPHLASQSAEFTSPDFPEAGRFHVTQLTAAYLQADGKDGWSVFQHRNLSGWANSDGLLFNTVENLDRIGLSYFRRQLKRPIWAVGPVLLLGDDRSRLGKQAGITLEQCLDWLDTKSPNSVLYISFGSMNTISASQMVQLAKALEQVRNVNFIWVVRPPLGFDITAEFRAEDWLPEGFIDNVVEDQKRGIVVVQWAPQVEILSHKAVGAFVTHCGWNSVLEALSRSVPLIGWPMAGEQFFNAKFLVEVVGVCVEVARGTNFEVRHQDIVDKIELVMGEESEKGKEMKRRALEVKEIIKDAIRNEEGVGSGIKGSSVKAMDEFFNAAIISWNEKTTKSGKGPGQDGDEDEERTCI
ncbi:UDP-glycosyltransferase 92A1 [Diospyros lotus]|uniref:UDP-glycosyltransferase 92A1 n=1 Tax=Diospyros lotus TaxID=55363 RepID=UPI00224F0CAF|nr:UDP-glycosyltransferase 92A1 [Diospyros lotus]